MNDRSRSAIANEAARIIQEQGITDYRAAKEKARDRLALGSTRALPSNAEVERALAERNRLFRSDVHEMTLRDFRRGAARMMRALDRYQPRLVGAVLSGSATEHTTVDLHVFSDPAETVSTSLSALGIRYRSTQSGVSFRRGQIERYPSYLFAMDDCDFRITVFPDVKRRHAPLSPVNGRPMRRASLKEIERLLGDDQQIGA